MDRCTMGMPTRIDECQPLVIGGNPFVACRVMQGTIDGK
jgi:hypothetical protein